MALAFSITIIHFLPSILIVDVVPVPGHLEPHAKDGVIVIERAELSYFFNRIPTYLTNRTYLTKPAQAGDL